MSKTYRNYLCARKGFKKPKSFNYLKGNQAFVDSLKQEGYSPRNREVCKANSQSIPNAWEDRAISALYEIDFAR